MSENRRNWSGSHVYQAEHLFAPNHRNELIEIVTQYSKVKALGTRHSFNSIADTQAAIVSMENFGRILSLDKHNLTVTIEAGVRYGELGQFLESHGFALPNLASLPHISVVGACATATHGSGVGNGNLATSVCRMEILKSDGSIVTIDRHANPDIFEGVVVGLGALGIVLTLTLDIVPSFKVRQDVYQALPFDQALAHFDTIMSGAYSTSLFTYWTGPFFDQVWRKTQTDDGSPASPTYFSATLADGKRNPIRDSSPENCTEQQGIPGPWNDRLPHFRMEFTPSSGEELQTEYFVDRRQAPEAIQALSAISAQLAPMVHVTEIRAIAADNLWMSSAFERDSIAIHFTWKKEWEAVHGLMPQIEAILAPFKPRPHWGKLFTLPKESIRASYRKLSDFEALVQDFDPTRKFSNRFLEQSLLPTD